MFEHKAALDRFKAGEFGFAAGASTVVLKAGVATNPNCVDGVAVVEPIGGVMVEAAIGGQQFTYQAKYPPVATRVRGVVTAACHRRCL